MGTIVQSRDEATAARVRSAAYSLIAHGFRYPEAGWLSSLADVRRWEAWPGSLDEAHGAALGALCALRGAIAGLSGADSIEALQAEFVALFGHAVRGSCPPYELEYGQSEVIQRASELADLGGFYAAFGLELSGQSSERVDHISIEAEFLAVLCAKEAWGLESCDRELLNSVRDCQRHFLEAHLGSWLPAFARRIADAEPGDFYRSLAGFADSFVAGECGVLGVPMGAPHVPLRPVDPAGESTQSCGVPGECGVRAEETLTQLRIDTRDEGC